MLSVLALFALIGVSMQVLRIARGSQLAYGLSFNVGLLLLALLLYAGHGGFRIAYGLLLLASAMALVFVGLTRAIDGVETAWFLPVMSAALSYCCWVVLVSESARQFLAEARSDASARRGIGRLRFRRRNPADAPIGQL
jgi:hypothetical protein